MPTPHKPYVISVGSTQHLVIGRGAAVSRAREISQRTGRPIRVERRDGLVSFEFRRGTLESYRFETHPRRS